MSDTALQRALQHGLEHPDAPLMDLLSFAIFLACLIGGIVFLLKRNVNVLIVLIALVVAGTIAVGLFDFLRGITQDPMRMLIAALAFGILFGPLVWQRWKARADEAEAERFRLEAEREHAAQQRALAEHAQRRKGWGNDPADLIMDIAKAHNVDPLWLARQIYEASPAGLDEAARMEAAYREFQRRRQLGQSDEARVALLVETAEAYRVDLDRLATKVGMHMLHAHWKDLYERYIRQRT